jgi:hypothetical protein
LSRLGARPPALIAALVLLALLPNLTIAALVWLPDMRAQPREAKVESSVGGDATGTSELSPKEEAKLPPALTVPSVLEANAGEDIVIPIVLDGTDGVPFRSAIAISGLPAGATLSSGRPYGATGWNLKPDEIGDLHLVVPERAGGETRLEIQLVAPAGEVISAAETTLRIAAKPEPAPVVQPTQASGAEPVVTEGRAEQTPQGTGTNADGAIDGAAQALNAASEDPGQSTPEDRVEGLAQSESADAAKLAPSDSEQSAKDGAGGDSVQPSTSVNLRDGPSSSAQVTGVIAKDTKLNVLDQKRRWVKVVNPATSESGWVYAPNLKGLLKRDRSAGADPPDPSSGTSKSWWKRMRNWLTGG